MISDTGKQLYRALFLPARDAAGRFVPRKAKVQAGRIGWSPIVLRWKKRGKNLTNVILHRAAASMKVLSFPQFHFHFANYQTHRSSTSISHGPTSATRVFDTRIIRDEPRANLLTAAPSLKSTLDYQRTLPSNRGSDRSPTSRDSAMSHLSASKTGSAYPVVPQPLIPRKYSFSRPGIKFRRQVAAKEDLASPFKIQSRILQWSLPVTARSRNQIYAGPPMPESKLLPPQYSRSEELVWRRVSKTTTDVTERVRHQEVFDSSEPRSHSVANQQTAVDVARVVDAVAAIPITKLDPALMDRLANDVIRRVEQRVRIERERRGL